MYMQFNLFIGMQVAMEEPLTANFSVWSYKT